MTEREIIEQMVFAYLDGDAGGECNADDFETCPMEACACYKQMRSAYEVARKRILEGCARYVETHHFTVKNGVHGMAETDPEDVDCNQRAVAAAIRAMIDAATSPPPKD